MFHFGCHSYRKVDTPKAYNPWKLTEMFYFIPNDTYLDSITLTAKQNWELNTFQCGELIIIPSYSSLVYLCPKLIDSSEDKILFEDLEIFVV